MHIEVGPVSAASARAWIAYATETLALLRRLPAQQLPAPALDAFASLLEEWRPVAQRDEPFRWSSDEAPERAQYLINALYVAGTRIEEEAASGRARLTAGLEQAAGEQEPEDGEPSAAPGKQARLPAADAAGT